MILSHLKGNTTMSNRERSCHTLKGVPLLSNRVISSHLKQVKGNTNTVKDHWCDRCCQIVIDHVEWSGHIWVPVLSFKDPYQCVCIHVSLSLCLCWCAYLSLFLSLLMCLSLSHSIFLSLSSFSLCSVMLPDVKKWTVCHVLHFVHTLVIVIAVVRELMRC